MLLYIKHFAQLCNRLWALTPVLAYALQNKKRLNVLYAKKAYVDCFPNLLSSKSIRFLFSHDAPHSKALEWRIALLSEKLNLEIKNELRNVDNIGMFSFFDGWSHSADVSYIAEHKHEIVRLFTPSSAVVNKVKSYFDGYDGLTVGVHIRRGDYKSYLNGKYFFSDKVYLDIIEEMRQSMNNGKKNVRFLICTNEKFDIPAGTDDTFTIDNADGVTDLYALSCCDYIAGPPSSYSQWASFYGDVPLFVILNENPQIHLNAFSKIVYFNHFENGRVLCFDDLIGEYYIL